MDDTDLAAAGDENLASTWALVGRSMGAEVIDDGPLTLVATGLPLLTEAIRFFGRRSLPWLLWVHDGVASGIVDAGRAAGLRDAGGATAMGLRSIEQSRPVPSELTIEIATTAGSLRDHALTFRDGFGLPHEVVDRLIQPALLDDSNVAGHLGNHRRDEEVNSDERCSPMCSAEQLWRLTRTTSVCTIHPDNRSAGDSSTLDWRHAR